MNISTKGRYGVIAMAELALHHGEGPIPIKMIAEAQHLSDHYLEQLFGPLRRAGLVKSVRGAQGGYLLGREPHEITVGDVLRVLEGPLAPAECAVEGATVQEIEQCCGADRCVARTVWVRLRDAIHRVVDSITLADLCEEARQANRNYMFYI